LRREEPLQLSFLAPDEIQMLSTLRESLRALSHLAGTRYEVGRLAEPEHDFIVRGPEDLAGWLAPDMEDLAQEQLRAVLLNTKNRVTRLILVYQGSLNEVSVRPADVYRDAVASGAAALVLVHNHPSGDPAPSPADVTTTRVLGEVGALLGVDLLDHLVIGRGGWTSLAREGLYTQPGRERATAQQSEPRAA
jgi:DNA repair protein RadC